MIRKDKEIKDPKLISDTISDCDVCRLGLSKDDNPYIVPDIVPVSFGYDGTAIYFHTAKNGMKIEYIKANNRVCFEFERGVQVVPDETSPCKWSFNFQSVIGFGKVYELKKIHDKVEGLHQITAQYSN
ncbi:pyridoxamine 5'-phosphate oxidase family protein [Thermodesulfobacteriota bacterium]